MLISPEYAAQNRALHEARPDYGANSGNCGPVVREIAEAHDCYSVLDYGCGKGGLGNAIGKYFVWQEYDPAIESKSSMPSKCDMVVCTDVLEHIEPECLDDVLAHIRSLCGKVAVLGISTRPAHKKLPDGRNAHLIVEPAHWWMAKLDKLFTVESFKGQPEGFNYIGTPR